MAAVAPLALLPLGVAHAAQPPSPWQAMARSDLEFIAAEMKELYISAVFPDPGGFSRSLAASYEAATQEAARVDSFGGYRATLNRFINSIGDAHVSLRFQLAPTSYAWPGFMAVYQGRRYFTTASVSGAQADGQEITACDGLPMTEWSRRVGTYEGGHPGLESSKASTAHAMFVDRGNPFLPRPVRCTIAGQATELSWRPISSVNLANKLAGERRTRSREAAITSFGTDGAWVRMGYFEPGNRAEAEAFHRLIADAADLRQKNVVVLDVRGNGGGSYNWLMGFLRGMYGQPYADHYARARLAITPVSRAHKRVVALYAEHNDSDDSLRAPKDITAEWDPKDLGLQRATASGLPYFRPAGSPPKAPAGAAPANPVKGKVYVLTDHDCASACIAFVDELKRIPGVTQIGLETHVDSRTGTPLEVTLPSGNGRLSLAVMTRDGRERDDNVPQRPTHEYLGDIGDTEALQRWIRTEVLVKDAAQR